MRGLQDRSGLRRLPERSRLWSGLRRLPERSGLWSGLHQLPERSGLWSGLWSGLHRLPDRSGLWSGLRGLLDRSGMRGLPDRNAHRDIGWPAWAHQQDHDSLNVKQQHNFLTLPGQENRIILLQFYSLCTGYLLSFVSVTKYYYLPIRP